jgi:pseudouridine-5'-phosphate glycosidase
MSEWIEVSSFVRDALAARRPVVALETTVVTHGLPHPQGLELAAELEQVVMEAGAVPATVGVLDGKLRIGLDLDELHRLATSADVAKLNLGNLAAQLARSRAGSTTVAATMFAAWQAGILVMATGGIGGVHRGVESSDDVSADLTALARFPVAVVCSGAKAVLDLPRTLERLETLGVPVYGHGSDEFPAFWRRTSGLKVDARFDTAETLAVAVLTHLGLGLGSGVVVANPVPDSDEMPEETYDKALAQALKDAEKKQLAGREVTPFLLERMRELSGGASVAANLALLRANAKLAASLAAAMARRG